MSNIIHLAEQTKSGAKGRSSEAKAAGRATMLKLALQKKENFMADDQIRVAANVYELIEQLHSERGLSKRAIAEACGLGGAGSEDSTKRFYEYTLPPDASETRKNSLAKKPNKYFAFASGLTRLTGHTEDQLLVRIFNGCSYGSGLSFSSADDWQADRWSKLVTQLQHMTSFVTRRAKADEYWQIAQQVTGAYDPATDELCHAGGALDGIGLSFGLSGYVAHPVDMPPVPSVLLGETILGEVELDGFELTECETGSVRIMLEFRLATAPMPLDQKLEPLLEYRLRADRMIGVGETLPLQAEIAIEGMDRATDRVAVIGESGGLQVPLDDDIWLPQGLFASEWMSGEHGWDEISPALLQDIFEDPPRPVQMAWSLDGNGYDSYPPSRFQHGTPGSCLYAELITERLEDKLLAECNRRYDQMTAFQQELIDRIADMEAEAQRRWLKDL